MNIVCKLCNLNTTTVRINRFIANVCPSCDREIDVHGFPVDMKYTVKNALTRRIDPANYYDNNEFIKMIESD